MEEEEKLQEEKIVQEEFQLEMRVEGERIEEE